MRLSCRLGFHDFRWPSHKEPWCELAWKEWGVECSRGCGARTLLRCEGAWGRHWRDKHPEPQETTDDH